MKLRNALLVAFSGVLLSSSADAAITISTNNLGGGGRQYTTSTGTLLTTANGNLRVGYFLDSSSSALRSGDLALIQSLFIPLGTNASPNLGASGGAITVGATAGRATGTIPGIAGTNTAVDGPVSSTTLVQGTRLFLLVYNASEFALFSDLALWKAPKDDPAIPGGASLTLAANLINLDVASSGLELFQGTYSTVGTANFLALAPIVPEPSTSLMALIAGMGLIARRRR